MGPKICQDTCLSFWDWQLPVGHLWVSLQLSSISKVSTSAFFTVTPLQVRSLAGISLATISLASPLSACLSQGDPSLAFQVREVGNFTNISILNMISYIYFNNFI